MTLAEVIRSISPADQTAAAAAKARWDAVAKPLGSLGLLEQALIRIAGATGSPEIALTPRAVAVMCADNGVVAQGVTQTGQEVTAVVTESMATGRTSVCRMAALAGAEVIPVDIGVARPVEHPGVRQCCVRRGTADITQGPAMTLEEARRAVEVGIDLAFELKSRGVRLLATGEMGIGNTTTSAAVACALLDRPAQELTGRGAGLSTQGLERKIRAVETALAVNAPRRDDPLDVLQKVGGLDLAGLAGVFLGGAACRLPVLVDGFISSVAALAACRMCPACGDYLLASHLSDEPASALVLEALGLRPLIRAGMRLGEGTGAVAAMPLLDMALAVCAGMPTFAQQNIEAYQPLT